MTENHTLDTHVALGAIPMEPQVVSALGRPGSGVAVARRCLDTVDLIGIAMAGTVDLAIVGAVLPGLAADTAPRVRETGVRILGLAYAEHEAARLRAFGIETLRLPLVQDELDPAALIALLRGEHRGRNAAPDSTAHLPAYVDADAGAGAGRLIAVWGPVGAPGRTTIAIGIADELARSGRDTLLVDADTFGPSIATRLGLLDDVSGLLASCRRADSGVLDAASLLAAARTVNDRLRVLTGIPQPDRWTELRSGSLAGLWQLCRSLPLVTVVDVGFGLEDDDLTGDPRGIRRHAATLTAVAGADVVVAVGSADQVGIERLVLGLRDLRAARPGVDIRPVANRVRSSTLGRGAAGQVRDALARHAGGLRVEVIPDDVATMDACLRDARSVVEVAPRSTLRKSLRSLADTLLLGADGVLPAA